MAGLTFIGDTNANTAASGQVSAGGSAPAGTTQGDLIFIPVAYKRSTQTVATPSGWTALTHRTVGTGAAGEGTGQIKIVLFVRLFPASFTNPSIDPGGTAPVRTAGFLSWRPDNSGWTIEVGDSFGSDTSSGTTFAVTGGTTLGWVEDDWVLAVLALTENITAPGIDVEGTTIGGASGATFAPFESKWISGGTAGDNLRSQTAIARCTGGTATTAPSVSVTLDAATTGGAVFYRIHPVHLPWHILGIDGTAAGNHFKLQAARNGAGVTYEKTRAEIVSQDGDVGYYEAPYFIGATPPGQEWCRFQVRMDSATTSGSVYPRSELREMQTNGTSEASWSTATNTHRMRAVIRVPHLPAVKPTVIFAQVHDGSSDVVQLCTELNGTSGLVEVKCRINGTSSGQPVLKLDYQEGDVHEYMIEIVAGTTKIYWDNLYVPVITTTAVSTSTAYFKTGCYPNTNETIDSATEFAQVDVRDLRVWHTGYSGDDGTPPPPPSNRVVSASLPQAVARSYFH